MWAPGDLASQAPDTAGEWAMAALPQWNTDESVDGAWGGSATSVTSNAKHPQQAAEFIAWLNDSAEGTDLPVKGGSIHPVARVTGAFPSVREIRRTLISESADKQPTCQNTPRYQAARWTWSEGLIYLS